MKHVLFQCIPPWEVVVQTLTSLCVPTELPCTFVKGELYLDNSAEIACSLEPYYLPCKAKIFLEVTNEKRWITILRHILKPHGWELIAKETTRERKKIILYTIQRSVNTLVETISVDFL
jgi:hypothetical protein